MQCPKCKTDNPDTLKFCGECGAQLAKSKGTPVRHTETLEAPREELTTGSTFAGRYQIIEELGRGGMGKVYKAQHTEIGDKIAIKLIKPDISSDKITIERFQNELKFARKISHRNVCRMYDLNKEEGSYYITMEYVAGQDLKGLIRQTGQLAVGTALKIAKQVCEGLAEAHRLGVVHRDLKPSNIMIDKQGNALIMDFGIARSLETKGTTGAGIIIGTPEYMSPEQVDGLETDQRSDIYSLGVILYEMLTGRVPFDGDTALTIAVKHKTEKTKDPRELNPQIPEELSNLIIKCMEKEKERRYQAVDEILSTFATIESDTTVTGIAAAKIPDTKKLIESEWKKSIAVLPFSNLSPEKEQEYFCDGLTEEIINALSHIRELRVVARTSAFAFKGKEIDIREVGEKLSVDAVLEGSVRKAGDKLRIIAQLINVADGYHLWSERFDCEMKEIFDIQDELTLEIVDKLKIELLGEERNRVLKRYTYNLEAHNLLLKSRYFRAKRTKEGLKKGMECVYQALEIDPAYALAHAHLARTLINLGWFGYSPPKEAFPKAKASAQKAKEIDSSLPHAYSALAWISLLYDWEWTAAERGFKKTLSLNPGFDNAHWGYAVLLVCLGRIEDALIAHKKALELNPLYLQMNADQGSFLRIARKYDEAQKQFEKTIEMDPSFGMAHFYMGILNINKGMYKEAIPEFQKATELTGGLSWVFGMLGYAYALLDQKAEAEKILHELEERTEKEYIRSTIFMFIHNALGDIDKSFEYLEKAMEEREPLLPFMNVEPVFDAFRSDPRFNALLKKMKLENPSIW